MKFSPSSAFVFLVTSSALHPVSADSDLTLSADVPIAQVKPRGAERAPLTLPELEFNFRIQADCHNELEAASISLAVADTRRTFNRAQIASGELNTVNLRIPSNQIAPLVIAGFCVAPAESDQSPAANGRQLALTIRSALSAQASLLCVTEGFQSMTYASAALDVQLQCEFSGDESDPTLKQ